MPRLPRRKGYLFARAWALAAWLWPLSASAQETAIHAAEDITADPPFVLHGAYTAETFGNVAGGLERGVRYLDNLDLVAEADLGELIGWRDATAQASLLYNNGRSVSALIGDAQAVSNIETGVRALRLYEAWIEQRIGRASVKLGLYDLNSEFDALESANLFLGSAHGIGTDIAQSGANGPSIFPVTALAARVAVEAGSGWRMRMAVLDGVPGDPARPDATVLRLSGRDGALLIAELEAPLLGRGKLLAGHWRYTAPQEQIAGGKARGNSGIYLRGEMRLHDEAEADGQGLDAFVRLGAAESRFNPFRHFLGAGVTYAGAIPGRDRDRIGLAVAAAFTSPALRRLSGASGSEVAIELTYRLEAADWVQIQPNVQYVVNPGATGATPGAVALGLRVELGFSSR